ncbi:MAG TPA: RNA methyltransferase [Bacilli bacterium]|nr:RNA methyltransferase [Bacilli bacterium]
MKTINSVQNPLIKQLLELKTNKGRLAARRFLISGYHLVEMAVAKRLVKLVLTLEPLVDLDPAIEQVIVSVAIMKKLADQVTPQGIIAVCEDVPQLPINGPRIAYLDQINDPGNLGTILRSASAFGIDMVLLSPDCVSVYNPKTIAASQGAIFAVNVREASIDDIAQLKAKGYRLVGTLLDAKAIPSNEYEWFDNTVVIFGNEAHGISEQLVPLLDDKIMIPITNVESLNVAMAASIVFYDMKYR